MSINREELVKKAFKQKLSQTLSVHDGNLLLLDLNGDYDNPNIQMFLLDGIRTRPVAIAIKDHDRSAIIIHEMECEAVKPLENLTEIITYKKSSDFYECIFNFYDNTNEVYAEISEGITKFEMLKPSIIRRLSDKLELKSADETLFTLRTIKTDVEISLMRKAINITNNILNEVEKTITTGVSEGEIYKTLFHYVVDTGLKFSFEPIIASGRRGSNPHPVPHTERELESGDHLLIDFGVKNEGYCSDITRQYIIDGDIKDSRFYEYNEILEKALLGEPVSGLTQKELAQRFKEIAEQEDFTSYERHSYGHGLGVTVHDIFPLISTEAVHFENKRLQDNMVFTFEPGFYGEFGGFRIENDYLVVDGYAEIL